MIERSRVAPIFSSDITTLGTATDIENDSQETRIQLAWARGRLSVQRSRYEKVTTHMNPMTAMTFTIENINSASP